MEYHCKKNIVWKMLKLNQWFRLIANDNWVEYTLRYVVSYKKEKNDKNRIIY